MRMLLAVLSIVSAAGIAAAQDNKAAPKAPGDAPQSTGRTVSPTTQGQAQPQGPTGPLETTTGGAPAESPQGQTPPGMQAAPDGSDKTMIEEKK
jgi:hypothetical protein